MIKKIAMLGVATAVAGTTLLAAAPAHAAGYCNGQIDYACTDRGDGKTFCTVWYVPAGGCLVGIA
jgi:hypothetical protein